MTRRVFLSVSLLSQCIRLCLARKPTADTPQEQYSKTITWYTSLFRPLEELATVVDRLRLLEYLRNLEKICDDMIADKEEIAALLGRKPPRPEDIYEPVIRLQRHVEVTRTRVTQVRSVLRDEFSKKGAHVSDELTDTVNQRKTWVEELLGGATTFSESKLATYAERARASENALKAANLKLSELIRFLKHGQSP